MEVGVWPGGRGGELGVCSLCANFELSMPSLREDVQVKLDTYTKWFVIIATLVVVAWEVGMVFTGGQVITSAVAEFTCTRPWIPLWIGFVIGHFFWPNRSLVEKIHSKKGPVAIR